MPLEPILAAFVPAPTLPDDLDVPVLRVREESNADTMVEQVAERGPDVAQKRIVYVPVAGGTIALAIYRPALDETLPVHIYFHGGGWVAGSGLSPFTDIVARERCVGAHCVTVAVDYRKAPEHPHPIPLDDCQGALQWVVDHAAEIGVDPSIITVGGASAGANLAAALCLKNRDESGPAITFQLLEVPALDLTLSLPSHADTELGSMYALHRSDVERLLPLYLGENGDPRHPHVSPLFAGNHAGLPPAYLMPAEYDLLRDDATAYAEKLNEAGVPAILSLQRGHIHISGGLTKILPAARAWRDEALAVLRAVHSGHLRDLVSGSAFRRLAAATSTDQE
ncbi:acetyl esterase [Plantibacter sp. VKM Ac-1784]|uniref:Acetyl esterase n=1 Tax=Plantibacter elymi (nom. nud.) TaxID=199708 RepID=A0ABY1RE06_9MICO|nr:alpha/beta hydrolase [Plantibacter sp. VKM Ac-1784]SMQ71294.1 acetyl esterase [Plantibacter sp. VKM Ac-1784]